MWYKIPAGLTLSGRYINLDHVGALFIALLNIGGVDVYRVRGMATPNGSTGSGVYDLTGDFATSVEAEAALVSIASGICNG